MIRSFNLKTCSIAVLRAAILIRRVEFNDETSASIFVEPLWIEPAIPLSKVAARFLRPRVSKLRTGQARSATVGSASPMKYLHLMQDAAIPTDGQILDCPCGRKWQVQRRKPDFNRRGSLRCRCAVSLAQDDQGKWTANLISPREHFAPLRKLIAHIGIDLLISGKKLRIPVWHWIRLHKLVTLSAPNRAVHTRLEIKSGRPT